MVNIDWEGLKPGQWLRVVGKIYETEYIMFLHFHRDSKQAEFKEFGSSGEYYGELMIRSGHNDVELAFCVPPHWAYRGIDNSQLVAIPEGAKLVKDCVGETVRFRSSGEDFIVSKRGTCDYWL